MTIQLARTIGQTLGVRSESKVRVLDAALRQYVREVPQSPLVPISGSFSASQITSGTFADARVAQSNVTQHEAALEIDWSQLTSIPSTFAPANHLSSGTWTPTDQSGGGLTFAYTDTYYRKHEDLAIIGCTIKWPVTADTNGTLIGGVPFAAIGTPAAWQGFVSYTDCGIALRPLPAASEVTRFALYDPSGVNVTNAQMSDKYAYVTLIYPVP